MLVKTGNHSSVPFFKLGKCRIGISCACKHTERLEANQRDGIILQWSPKHWISSEHRIKSLHKNLLREETICAACQLFQ